VYSKYFDDVKVDSEEDGWILLTGIRKKFLSV